MKHETFKPGVARRGPSTSEKMGLGVDMLYVQTDGIVVVVAVTTSVR